MGYIYKVTNKINNKSYIGQTINDPIIRWRHHRNEIKYGSDDKFHRAIRKYGADNFIWEVIEEVENQFLNDREKYWIAFYDTNSDSGYNLTPGGDLPPRNDIPVICLETKKIYSSAKEASKDTGISACHIAECSRGAYTRLTAGGYHWMHLDDYQEFGEKEYRKTKNELCSKAVLCVETNIVYPSVLAASKATGVKRDTISAICKGKRKKIYGYHWRYAEQE